MPHLIPQPSTVLVNLLCPFYKGLASSLKYGGPDLNTILPLSSKNWFRRTFFLSSVSSLISASQVLQRLFLILNFSCHLERCTSWRSQGPIHHPSPSPTHCFWIILKIVYCLPYAKKKSIAVHLLLSPKCLYFPDISLSSMFYNIFKHYCFVSTLSIEQLKWLAIISVQPCTHLLKRAYPPWWSSELKPREYVFTNLTE